MIKKFYALYVVVVLMALTLLGLFTFALICVFNFINFMCGLMTEVLHAG